jgi:hypothetical protein
VKAEKLVNNMSLKKFSFATIEGLVYSILAKKGQGQ